MKTKIDFLIMTCLLAASAFLFSSCYTQLANSEPEITPAPYYVDEAVEEELSDYEEDSEYEEQDMYDEEVYDDEDDEDVRIVRKYYYDVNYSGRPWAYDPFFDPYFYDEYTPYSTHVSVSVNYYDPWYVEPWCYNPWYSGVHYYPSHHFGFYVGYTPYYGFPYRYGYRGYNHGYFDGYYGGYSGYYSGHQGITTSELQARRSFSRRGQRRDAFGYGTNRLATNTSTTSSGGSSRLARTTSSSSDTRHAAVKTGRRTARTKTKIARTGGDKDDRRLTSRRTKRTKPSRISQSKIDNPKNRRRASKKSKNDLQVEKRKSRDIGIVRVKGEQELAGKSGRPVVSKTSQSSKKTKYISRTKTSRRASINSKTKRSSSGKRSARVAKSSSKSKDSSNNEKITKSSTRAKSPGSYSRSPASRGSSKVASSGGSRKSYGRGGTSRATSGKSSSGRSSSRRSSSSGRSRR